ncbi:MAG: hypothetical protein EXS17_07985 [Phycisphaerales bacterium]|nr:hypothetical protein [Phycisphaerales bacterium]
MFSIRTAIVTLALVCATHSSARAETLEFSGPRGAIISGTVTARDSTGSAGLWSISVEGADKKQVVLGFAADQIDRDAADAEIPLLVVVQSRTATAHARVIVRRGERIVSTTEIVIHRTRDLADLNADGNINAADLTLMLAAWGRCGRDHECIADLDGDGWVDGRDLSALVAAWQP